MVAANRNVDFAELKARNPLGDAVEAAGVALKGKGRVRQGVCPFHDEAEGSFTVYADTEQYHCFGCGAHGDVLDFVGRMEGLTLPEAIRRLDDGTTPPAAARSNQSTPTQRPTAASVPPRDPALLTAAARFYGGQLRRSPVAVQYLASRGIGLDAAMCLGLGYATGHGLREHLQTAGFGGANVNEIPACSWNGARNGSTGPSPFPTWPGAGRGGSPGGRCNPTPGPASRRCPAPSRCWAWPPSAPRRRG